MITTEEGNKLIAKFDGYTLIPPEMRDNPKNWSVSYWEKIVKGSGKYVLCSEGKEKYYSDWNWLMPIVQKINEPYKFKIIDEVDTNEWYISRRLFDLSITSSILEVWNAVVNFIIWYNEKNKS